VAFASHQKQPECLGSIDVKCGDGGRCLLESVLKPADDFLGASCSGGRVVEPVFHRRTIAIQRFENQLVLEL